jgi:hypothetical protein
MKAEAIGQGVNTAPMHHKDRQEVVAQRAPEFVKSGADASRQALNVSIMQVSVEVSLSAGNHSMSLLFQTAIDHLNEVLAPEFGDNAIQAAADSGMDFGPQATADRIVSMSTAFFGMYAENHPEKGLETTLNDFIKLIGGGIDKGFAEARQILDGLKVLEGDIASNIDKTYELVQLGLKAFVENHSRPEQTGEITEKDTSK